jgi:hypothetical protein
LNQSWVPSRCSELEQHLAGADDFANGSSRA